MKNKFIVAALVLLGFAAGASAQVYSPTLFSLTNANIATVAGSTAVTTTNIINLTKKSALSFQPNFNVASGTSQVTFFIYASADGTNFTTAPWSVYSVSANGTTVVTGFTNWSTLVTPGITALNVGIVSNANAGIFTNKASLFSRYSEVAY